MKADFSLGLGTPGAKALTEVKDASGAVVDYRDVTIKGYLSTFESFTPADRDGDAVVRGAFKDTIPRFMGNPVLLVDHRRSVETTVGKFTVMREDEKGLYVEAVLSNAPTEAARNVRWKVAEGILSTLSMGGIFYYHEGGTKIFRVDLHEGSLVPIPANPDATVSVRALTPEEEAAVEA